MEPVSWLADLPSHFFNFHYLTLQRPPFISSLVLTFARLAGERSDQLIVTAHHGQADGTVEPTKCVGLNLMFGAFLRLFNDFAGFVLRFGRPHDAVSLVWLDNLQHSLRGGQNDRPQLVDSVANV